MRLTGSDDDPDGDGGGLVPRLPETVQIGGEMVASEYRGKAGEAGCEGVSGAGQVGWAAAYTHVLGAPGAAVVEAARRWAATRVTGRTAARANMASRGMNWRVGSVNWAECV